MARQQRNSALAFFFDLNDRSIGPMPEGTFDPLTYSDDPWLVPLNIERFVPLSLKLARRLHEALLQGSVRERLHELSGTFFWSQFSPIHLDATEEIKESIQEWLGSPRSTLRFYRVARGSSSHVGSEIRGKKFNFAAEGPPPFDWPFERFDRSCYDIAEQNITDVTDEEADRYGLEDPHLNTDGFPLEDVLKAFNRSVLRKHGPKSARPTILPESVCVSILRIYYTLFWEMVDRIQSLQFPDPATEFADWADRSSEALGLVKKFRAKLTRQLEADGYPSLIETLLGSADLDEAHEEFLLCVKAASGATLAREDRRDLEARMRIMKIWLDPDWHRTFGSCLSSDPDLYDDLIKALTPALKQLEKARIEAAKEVKRRRNVSGTDDALNWGRACEAYIKGRLAGDLNLGTVDLSPEEMAAYHAAGPYSWTAWAMAPELPGLLRWVRDPSFRELMNGKLVSAGMHPIGYAPEPHPNFWAVVGITPEHRHLDFLFARHAGWCKQVDGGELAAATLFSILETWEGMNDIRKRRPMLRRGGRKQTRGRPSLGREDQDAKLLRERDKNPREPLTDFGARQDPPMSREEAEKSLQRAREAKRRKKRGSKTD